MKALLFSTPLGAPAALRYRLEMAPRSPAKAPARQFTSLATLWRRLLRGVLRKHHLSVAEYLALGAAVEQVSSNQKSIATRAGLDAMSVSRAMASLEERGLLRREVQADSRNWEVTVTSKARALLRTADKSAAAAFSDMLSSHEVGSLASIRTLLRR